MKTFIRREIIKPEPMIDKAVIFVTYDEDELFGEYCFCICDDCFTSRDFYFYGEDFKEVYDYILDYVKKYNEENNNIIKKVVIVKDDENEGEDKLEMFAEEDERYIVYLKDV